MTKTIDLELTDWGYGPAPFGRIPAANGKSQLVFVPGTVDGDVVQAQVVGASGAALWAIPTVYTARSSTRQKATCAGVGYCECSFQHIAYEKQLEIKQHVLQNHFERFGPKSFPPPTIIETLMPEAIQRNQVRLHPDEARALGVSAPLDALRNPFKGCKNLPSEVVALLSNIKFSEEENDVTSIEVSINANEEILVALRTASGLIPEIAFDVALNAAFLKPDGRVLPLSGDPYLWQWIGEKANMIPAGSAFPQWEPATQTLSQMLRKQLSSANAILNVNAGAAWLLNCVDLPNIPSVVLEENEAYVDAIATNLDHFSAVELYQDQLPTALDHLESQQSSFDMTVFQSAGQKITGKLAKQLAALTAEKLVLIGQTPIGIAKDSLSLCEQGFEIILLGMLDTVPYTHRFTPIVVFSRN